MAADRILRAAASVGGTGGELSCLAGGHSPSTGGPYRSSGGPGALGEDVLYRVGYEHIGRPGAGS